MSFVPQLSQASTSTVNQLAIQEAIDHACLTLYLNSLRQCPSELLSDVSPSPGLLWLREASTLPLVLLSALVKRFLTLTSFWRTRPATRSISRRSSSQPMDASLAFLLPSPERAPASTFPLTSTTPSSSRLARSLLYLSMIRLCKFINHEPSYAMII